MLKTGITCNLPSQRHGAGMGRARIFAAAVLLVAAPAFCKAQAARRPASVSASASAGATIVVADSTGQVKSAMIDSASVVFKGGCLVTCMPGRLRIRDPRVGRHFLGTAPQEIGGRTEQEGGKTILHVELLAKDGRVVKVSYTYSDPVEARRKGYDLPSIAMSEVSVEPAK